MKLTPILERQFQRMASQLVDSTIPETRAYWRTKYCGASPEEASDPRPWNVVFSERKES